MNSYLIRRSLRLSADSLLHQLCWLNHSIAPRIPPGQETGRGKKEEGRGRREEGRGKREGGGGRLGIYNDN